MEEIKKEDIRKTKKNIGITMLCVSSVLFIFSTFEFIYGIKAFLLGVFGFMLYPLLVLLAIFGVALIMGMKFVYSPRYLIYLGLCFFFFVCVLHIIFTGFNGTSSMTYGEYLSAVYHQMYTPGGLLVGLFTFPLVKLLHAIAGIVIYGIALIICMYFVANYIENVKAKKLKSMPKEKYKGYEETASAVQFDKLFDYEEEKKVEAVKEESEIASFQSNSHKIAEEESIFVQDEEKEDVANEVSLAREKLGLKSVRDLPEDSLVKGVDAEEKLFAKPKEEEWQMRGMKSSKPSKYVYEEPKKEEKKLNPLMEKNKEYLSSLYSVQSERDNPIINAEDYEDYKRKMQEFNERRSMANREQERSEALHSSSNFSMDIEPKREESGVRFAEREAGSAHNNHVIGEFNSSSEVLGRDFSEIEDRHDFKGEDSDFITEDVEEDDDIDFIKPQPFEIKQPPHEEEKSSDVDSYTEEELKKDYHTDDSASDLSGSLNNTFKLNTTPRNFNYEIINGPAPQKEIEPNFEYGNYVRPPIDLLKTYLNEGDTGADIPQKIEALESVLESFNIPAKVENVTRGAAVTRFELHMPMGITVKRVEAHAQDITLALAASKDVRIEAPIKGKSAVGIEVPNAKVDIVGLKDIIESPQFVNSRSPLLFALGKDVDGSVRCCNLDKMPHLLVAGSTNSGKSSCLNSLLISMIYHTTPSDLRLVLVDPKQVEFTTFNGLPHLLTPNTITDMKKVIPALDWIINEMERRYALLRDNRVKNLEEYNEMDDVKLGKKQKLPYIVLIVDEFADVILTVNRKEFEERIQRIAQKARAAGIHLILATQRPSVDVISGVIKTNLPSQIAFAVTRATDSVTILGQGGAENLLGRGDMLYAPIGGEPVRVQGSWISTQEINDVVDFVKDHNPGVYDENIVKAINNTGGAPQGGGGGYNATPQIDPLMPEVLRAAIESGQVSASMLQRKFAIGFQRASKIVDQMEQAGFISPSDGSKPRTVYITMEDYNKMYGG